MSILALAILVAPVSATTAPSVEWEKTYGTPNFEYITAALQTKDGGYVFAGPSYNESSESILVVRTDSQGNTIWQKRVSELGMGEVQFLKQTGEGYELTTVYGGSIRVTKLNLNGDVVESKTLLDISDWAFMITSVRVYQTNDDGYLLAVSTYNREFNEEILLAKINSQGEILWKKSLGGSGFVESVEQTDDGGCVVAWNSIPPDYSTSNIVITKLSNDGSIQWEVKIGGDCWDEVDSIQQTYDGGYIIVGGTNSYSNSCNPADSSSFDIFVAKIDKNGRIVWQKVIGDHDFYEWGDDVKETTDGNYIIVGHDNDDIIVLKMDSNGEIIWSKQIWGPRKVWAQGVLITRDYGYLIYGAAVLSKDNYDFYVVKLSPDEIKPVIKIEVSPKDGKWDLNYNKEWLIKVADVGCLIGVAYDIIPPSSCKIIDSLEFIPEDTDGDGKPSKEEYERQLAEKIAEILKKEAIKKAFERHLEYYYLLASIPAMAGALTEVSEFIANSGTIASSASSAVVMPMIAIVPADINKLMCKVSYGYISQSGCYIIGNNVVNYDVYDYLCPINVTITDAYGRKISDSGINEIPGAYYIQVNDSKTFIVPSGNYNVEIVGYNSGNFTLNVLTNDINSGFSTFVSFENVSITRGTTVHLENMILKVDYDADGSIDRTLTPDIHEEIVVQFPPIASFTFSPSSLLVGQIVTFDASSSYDPDGSIVSYEWDFGDGTTATGKTIQHTYSQAGTYTVTLIVTDDDGFKTTISKTITVDALTPPSPPSFPEVDQKEQLKQQILQLIIQYLTNPSEELKMQILQLILEYLKLS